MSSLAPAPEAAGPRARHAEAPMVPRRTALTGDAPLAVAVAAVLALLAFTTKTGGGVSPDTADVWSQILMVLAAATAGVLAILAGTCLGRAGRRALLAFVALAVVTYASVAWSVQPAISWFEGDRTLSYLAAFALGLLAARAAPSRWPALLGGVALYALAICGWALLCRVFPAAFDAARSSELGRLGLPFGYFNATGLVAALGIPAWLWLGTLDSRGRSSVADGSLRGRRADAAGTIASIPAIALLVTTLLMSYSRGALAAAIVGCAVWFAVSPRRLSGALVLGVGAVGGLALGLWATAQTPLSHDYIWLVDRVQAGHRFGIVLAVALGLLTLAGTAVVRARVRVSLGETVRRRIGIVLLAGLALVPVFAVVVFAVSSRGLTGEVSHLWSSLTNPHSVVSDAPGRLTELGSSRPRYWGDGLRVAGHAPVAGVGAGGFAVAVRHYAADRVGHAHSYAIQTFADLGVIGLLVSAVLLVTCVLGWRRAVRPARAEAGAAAAGEPAAEARTRAIETRTGIGALVAVAVVFGVHSAIDWTWFIPGCAVPALLCGGWAVGWRGFGPEPVPSPGVRVRLVRSIGEPLRAGAALGLLAVALLAAWFIWQPLRSADAQSAAEDALLRGAAGQALTDARTAASAMPVDARPHELIASILGALGRPAAARDELLQATRLQPANPDTWYALGQYDATHRLPGAQAALARARALDPYAANR